MCLKLKSPKNVAKATWESTQAKFEIAIYVPRIFPVDLSSENIFSSSSKEKMIRVFREKAKINTIIITHVFLAKASIPKVKASKNDTKSRNLYPPILFNIFGAIKRANTEAIDQKAY